jgi:hypothetical protein
MDALIVIPLPRSIEATDHRVAFGRPIDARLATSKRGEDLQRVRGFVGP